MGETPGELDETALALPLPLDDCCDEAVEERARAAAGRTEGPLTGERGTIPASSAARLMAAAWRARPSLSLVTTS